MDDNNGSRGRNAKPVTGWGKVPRAVMGEVSPTATAVYAALASFVNKQGECWPSQDRLAEILGKHPGTIRRAIAELVGAGHVTVRPRLIGNAKRGNVYTLQIPERADMRELENSRTRISARSIRAPVRVRYARERSSEIEQTNEEQTNAVALETADEQVFRVWVKSSGRTGRTVLSAQRRKLIRRALADYPVDEVCDAVRGWQRSPFHAGQNDRHQVYNDIELLLRDAKHIEQFRDLWRDSGPVPGLEADPDLAQIRRVSQMMGGNQ